MEAEIALAKQQAAAAEERARAAQRESKEATHHLHLQVEALKRDTAQKE